MNRKFIYYISIIFFLIIFLLMTSCQLFLSAENYKDDLTPLLFFSHANQMTPTKIEQPWKIIELTSNYVGRWCISGDIDSDGELEIVSAENCNIDENHYTTAVAAFNLDNSILWEWGNPDTGQNHCSYDVACQIYDIDNEGNKEVVIAGDQQLFVLDGATGSEKWSFPIPENASDCIVFVILQGNPTAQDIIVKTRYSKIWAYTNTGRLLWQVDYPGGYRTAHQPIPIDIDNDGMDEIMAGYAIINPDGTIRWTLDSQQIPIGDGHLDCCRIYKHGYKPEDFRLIITFCEDEAIAMIDGNGKVLWSIRGYHFESVDIGEVHPDYDGKEILVDIDHSQ